MHSEDEINRKSLTNVSWWNAFGGDFVHFRPVILTKDALRTSPARMLPFRTMKYDTEKVDEIVLALLHLTTFVEGQNGTRAWKAHDWDALDRLHAKGYISDSKNKAKSVLMTEEGVKRSRELFEQHFGKNSARANDKVRSSPESRQK